ncbi:MAG: Gx transporter family protein [Nitrospira sp.]|nr:Gx transporter family protein [Nitrospira sp.]
MQQQDKYRIALLSAFALGLHGFENLLPSPIPWLRFGLANIVTLITLLLYGMRPAVMVTLIRVMLASLIAGSFLGPAFILSLGGGIASTLVMGFVLHIAPRLFSTMGLSIIGALFHNLAQLFLAYFLFIQRIEAILLITPVIILFGTLTGTVNGVVSALLMKNLIKYDQKVQNVNEIK